MSNLNFIGSRTTASPTLSSGSSSGYSSLLTTFDSSKLFPLNPVAKEFVPAPKSWAAIASSAPNNKPTPTKTILGGDRQKAALPASLKSPVKPTALKGRNGPSEKQAGQKDFQPERNVPHKQSNSAAKGMFSLFTQQTRAVMFSCFPRSQNALFVCREGYLCKEILQMLYWAWLELMG